MADIKGSAEQRASATLGAGFFERVLELLSHHERIALRLRHVERLELHEVAARMNLPEGVVARILADAERTLTAARRAFVDALQEHAPELAC
jgi:DNA-directed RNA polymerase specialized sigma24 family protein